MDEAMKNSIRELWKNSEIAYVGSVNENGFPQIKAMWLADRRKIKAQYISTNTSAVRTQSFLRDTKACVYYCDANNVSGALFTGTMEVLTDHDIKEFIWSDGDEQYYPKGVDDEDYCVLKFTPKTVKYWPDETKTEYSIDEL